MQAPCPLQRCRFTALKRARSRTSPHLTSPQVYCAEACAQHTAACRRGVCLVGDHAQSRGRTHICVCVHCWLPVSGECSSLPPLNGALLMGSTWPLLVRGGRACTAGCLACESIGEGGVGEGGHWWGSPASRNVVGSVRMMAGACFSLFLPTRTYTLRSHGSRSHLHLRCTFMCIASALITGTRFRLCSRPLCRVRLLLVMSRCVQCTHPPSPLPTSTFSGLPNRNTRARGKWGSESNSLRPLTV